MSTRSIAIKGVAWNSTGKIGTGVVTFLVMMVLARLLTPFDFGLMELLVVFTMISETFVDSGFSQAVIRDKDATDRDLTSVFYLNLSIAVIIYACLFFSAPFIADFYDAPQLTWLSRVVFLAILFNSFSIIQDANFARQVNFKPHAVATLVSISFAGGVAVFMAIKGFGVWALAVNLLLYAVGKAATLWILSNWRPKGWISLSSVKKYFKFGGNLLVIGLTDKIVSNLESLLIGKFYTKSDLGYFSQARKLETYVIQTSTTVIRQVSYPILAKVQDDEKKLKEYYRKLLGLTMIFTMPISAFVLASADNFLAVVFGSQWLPATPYFRLWTICGLFVALYSIFTNIFLVMGKSRLYLKVSLLRQAARVITIVLLIKTSIFSLLVGITFVTVVSGVFYLWIGGRLINYNLVEVLKDIRQIFLASCCAGLAAFLLSYIEINVFFTFFSQIITMFFLYWFVIARLKNQYYYDFKEMILSVVKRK